VNKLKNILIFRQSSLGDVILTLPVVHQLKTSFPESSIDYITKSQYAALLDHDPAVDRVIQFTDNDSFKSALKMLKDKKYDLFVDLQVNFRSMIVSAKQFSSKTVRYKKRRLAREMIVRKPHLNLKVDHTISAYFRSLTKIGITSEPTPPVLTIPEDKKKAAREFIENCLPEKTSNLIAICPGAKHFEKKWPSEHYAEVANKLLENENNCVVVVSSSTDELSPDLGIENPRLLSIRDQEILYVASILAQCRFAVTNDSGLMHLANAAGSPVIAIFGPTNPRLGFGPSLDGSKIICNYVQCSPCSVHGQKTCYKPVKFCFETITPESILKASEEFLQ